MVASFQKQSLNFPSLTGKKHLDVRALETLLQRWPDCQNSPEGRRFYRWIEPRAQKAAKKQGRKLAVMIDTGRLAIPKKTPTLDRKRALKIELEALCKKIVRARDSRQGWAKCCTCPSTSEALQWGHFISRHNSSALIYSVDNTALQCGRCNGPGQGEYAKFRDWINNRSPGLAEKLEEYAKANARWSWTVVSLEAQKEKLLKICEKMGV